MGRCWLNMGATSAAGTLVPVFTLAVLAIILAEAAGMGGHTPTPLHNKIQFTAALYAPLP